MIRTALVFPGQESYMPGFLASINRSIPRVQRLLEAIDATCAEHRVEPVSALLADTAAPDVDVAPYRPPAQLPAEQRAEPAAVPRSEPASATHGSMPAGEELLAELRAAYADTSDIRTWSAKLLPSGWRRRFQAGRPRRTFTTAGGFRRDHLTAFDAEFVGIRPKGITARLHSSGYCWRARWRRWMTCIESAGRCHTD